MMKEAHELIQGLKETMLVGEIRQQRRTITLLKEELGAIKDLEESPEYVQGFEHAILLLEETWK